MKFAAPFLFAAAVAAAQTTTPPSPPSPPACLSGPVTSGNVTLSCSMIDATGGADPLFFGGSYLLGIKASSSDSAVNAIQVDLTILQNTNPNATSPTAKRSVTVLKASSGMFTYVFSLSPTDDGKGNSSPTVVIGITIQELKPSSSQAF